MSAESAAHPEVASGIELLSAWIEAQMAQRRELGLSIGIVHDQELVWARGFGYADLNEPIPATAATRYRIASITKLFTSTGILMLRDAGMLQLDDPVERHLPWSTTPARCSASSWTRTTPTRYRTGTDCASPAPRTRRKQETGSRNLDRCSSVVRCSGVS